ncbi:hypothetical protein Tco_0520160 [Tanacetum coccineum]
MEIYKVICLDTLPLVKPLEYTRKGPKRVEENLHIDFLEDQPNVAGTGPNWMFDLDFLTKSMNYIPVSVENQVNVDAGIQDSYVAGSSGKDKGPTQEYILLPLHPHRTRILVEDVAPAAHEKPFESFPKDNDKWCKSLDDSHEDKAFEKEKRNNASKRRQLKQPELTNLSTVGHLLYYTATTPILVQQELPTFANASKFKENLISSLSTMRKDSKGFFSTTSNWIVGNQGLFLAFASYMGFAVYQMDVISAFLYGTIEEEMENGFRRETAVLKALLRKDLQAISATIIGHEKLITEDSLRRHLKLDDAEGISSLSNEEIFEHLAHMGYVTNSESLTFFKGHFSPQWKFFIHTILHCLSSKKTAWDQFSSNIATTLICLATSRRGFFPKQGKERLSQDDEDPIISSSTMRRKRGMKKKESDLIQNRRAELFNSKKKKKD